MAEIIDAIDCGTSKPVPQDSSLASKAPRLKKTDGQVDWSRSAIALRNQVRALVPWPETYTFWQRPNGEPLRLILETVQVDPLTGPPGQVIESKGDRLIVAAGENSLKIERLKPAGKRSLSVGEFLRGYPVREGEQFG